MVKEDSISKAQWIRDEKLWRNRELQKYIQEGNLHEDKSTKGMTKLLMQEEYVCWQQFCVHPVPVPMNLLGGPLHWAPVKRKFTVGSDR